MSLSEEQKTVKYDFDKEINRRATMSVKWDVSENELPMWIADMDFEAPEFIKNAVIKTAEHGVFGYSMTPVSYFEAIAGFFERRHGYRPDVSEMVYSSGVVAAISSMVRKLTTPAENVLVQAPVYNNFYNSILNNGRNVISSDLIYKDGKYSIDFVDLEEKLANPQTTLMILCNPHNPVGKIWSKEELLSIGKLCLKHGVTVISDEIHCDILRPGVHYTPFASLDERLRRISVCCVSSSKTFNMAGMQSACLIIPDPHLRHRVWRGLNTDEVGEPNIFSMAANIAAFNEGDEWVDALMEYIFENRKVAEDYIKTNLPRLRPVAADATYLLWLDISAYSSDAVAFAKHLRESTGLYVSAGTAYGRAGEGFLRINLATQRKNVLDALGRLSLAIDRL